MLSSPTMGEDEADIFRTWLVRRAEDEGLTQQALAVALGISVSPSPPGGRASSCLTTKPWRACIGCSGPCHS